MKILIVEDEKTINKLVSKRLSEAGYSVVSCWDGEEALNTLKTDTFDGIVMDIMMPKMSGLEVLERMQELDITTPVLLLTAKDSIKDRVTGLDLGAHDYLVKPFHFDELLARVRAMLRVKSSNNRQDVMQVADLILDMKKHIVTRNGKVIDLTAKEFEVLEYLMKYEGEVLSRERIESEIWKTDYCGVTNVIDVYIRYLRKKIDDDYSVKLIQTIRGVGYSLRVE
jgi:DNA-binding response OmpR family regulator